MKSRGRPSFWRERIAPLASNVDECARTVGEASEAVGELFKIADLSEMYHKHDKNPVTDEYAVKSSVADYAYYSERTVVNLCRCAHDHWSEGDLVTYCLVGRLIFEYAAAIHYVLRIIQKGLANEATWNEVRERLKPMFLGSRRPHWYKWMGDVQPPSINVLTQIGHLKDVNPNAEDDYAFLSESCHPNFVQHYYLHRAGSSGDLAFSMSSEGSLAETLARYVAVVSDASKLIRSDLLELVATCSLPCRSVDGPEAPVRRA